MSDDIKFMLGQIQATVEAINSKVDDLSRRLDHHSNRLRKLERWQATLAGAAAIAGMAVGAFIKKWLN